MFGGSYVIACAVMSIYQRDFIYHPPAAPFESCPELKASGWQILDRDGVRAWFKPSKNNSLAVIAFHGNASSACSMGHIGVPLAQKGYAVMMAEYPGYGGRGEATQENIQKAAIAAYDLLSKLLPGTKIVVYGESLGTAPATWVSANRPATGLIMTTPFPSMTVVATQHYPWAPTPIILRDRWPAARWASRVAGPVMIFQGDSDRVISWGTGREAGDAFPTLKKFVTIRDAGHGNVTSLRPGQFWANMDRFLQARVKEKS